MPAIEQRWADNQLDRLPSLAVDLINRKAAVIVGNVSRGGGGSGLPPATIPIVFVVGDDPVKMGLVASLNRPEGNLTGMTFFGGSAARCEAAGIVARVGSQDWPSSRSCSIRTMLDLKSG